MQLTRLQGGSPSKAKALIPQNKKLIDTTSSIVTAANSLIASIKLSNNFNFTPPLPLIGSLRPLYGAFYFCGFYNSCFSIKWYGLRRSFISTSPPHLLHSPFFSAHAKQIRSVHVLLKIISFPQIPQSWWVIAAPPTREPKK